MLARMKFSLHLLLLFAAVLAGAATPEELALAPYKAPAAPDAEAWPRERLLGFMHELADFVEKNHTVTDPSRKTYGMVYEFWKDGKKIQEFGLDSMHDGAWFMSALVTAHRADPLGDWLERAQKYQVPFYANLLIHSDQLFPKMMPSEEDKQHWNAPLRGWTPRGWDDGSGIDRKGQPLPDGYFTGSNHLAQDLADALMNVWLTTRDPQITEALGHLRDYKQQCFGDIQGVDIAAAVSAGQADAFLKYKLPDFSPQALAPYYTGLFEKKGHRLVTYDDGLAWLYRQGTAVAWISGEMPRGFAAYAIGRCYGSFASMETFFDDRPCESGAWFFDLQRPPAFAEGKGRLQEYASTSKNFYGPRGVEIAWVAAGILPELKAMPGLWDGALKRNASAVIARMVDEPPVTDGLKDDVYAKSAPCGDDTARVTLVSDPRNLHIFVETTRSQLTITFQEESGEVHPVRSVTAEAAEEPMSEKPRHLSRKSSGKSPETSTKKKGKPAATSKVTAKTTKASLKEKTAAAVPEAAFTHGGRLLVTRDGQCIATNEKGERLLAASAFKAAGFQQGEGDAWTAEVRMPYTFVPAQNAWINGVDFGRYKIRIDASAPVTVCLISEPARIQKRLENGVLGAIDFWSRVWKESGVIPSGWRSPTVPAGSWEISDAGGYAHLISTMALWLIYQDGKREWEVIREQFPETAKPAPPLPASVLEAQGIGNDQ